MYVHRFALYTLAFSTIFILPLFAVRSSKNNKKKIRRKIIKSNIGKDRPGTIIKKGGMSLVYCEACDRPYLSWYYSQKHVYTAAHKSNYECLYYESQFSEKDPILDVKRYNKDGEIYCLCCKESCQIHSWRRHSSSKKHINNGKKYHYKKNHEDTLSETTPFAPSSVQNVTPGNNEEKEEEIDGMPLSKLNATINELLAT